MAGSLAYPNTEQQEASEGTILLEDDFQSYRGGERPQSYTWFYFPHIKDDPYNGVVGPESGNQSNKVLRMYTASEIGLSVADYPGFSRHFSGAPPVGSAHLLVLQFDYRNLGTASAWLYLGLKAENRSADAVEAVMFNGTAAEGRGGFFLKDGSRRAYPASADGEEKLKNLAKGTWYRVMLQIHLHNRTVRLTVQDLQTSVRYFTPLIPFEAPWTDEDVLDQLVFGCREGSAKAPYKFEMDNIRVYYESSDD